MSFDKEEERSCWALSVIMEEQNNSKLRIESCVLWQMGQSGGSMRCKR